MNCCNNSGGRVSLTIDNQKISVRAGVTVMPTNVEKEVDSAADGTMFTTVKAVPATAEFTISDKCGLTLDDIVNACKIDASIKLIDMNRTYLFTNASVVGRPSINTENGEISGLKIASQRARQVNR